MPSRYSAVLAFMFLAYSVLSLAQSPTTYEQALEKVGMAISERLAASSQKTATVLDFTNLESMPTQLGRLVSQDLTDKFVTRVTRMNWIDRTQRDFVLKENRLAADKLMDPATRKQLGKLMGVDTIVVGTVTMLGRQVRLQARAIDIETARVLAVDSATFQLPESMAGLADRALTSTGDSPAPGSRTEPIGGFFRNRVLAVQARSLTITPGIDGNWLGATATVEVENISGQDFWIGVVAVGVGPCAISGGPNPPFKTVSGVNHLESWILQNIVKAGSVDRRKELTALPAGGKTVIVAANNACERNYNGAFLGRTAPATFDFVMDYGGNFQRFSAGIADFPVTSNSFLRKD